MGGSALASRRFDPAAGIAPGDGVAGGGGGGRMGSYSRARVYFYCVHTRRPSPSAVPLHAHSPAGPQMHFFATGVKEGVPLPRWLG